MKKKYFPLLIMTALVLSLSGCSDDDEPQTTVPQQTTESQSVSLTLSLGMLTRAVGADIGTRGVKTHWEQGDKVYFSYTKTFATDQEILNVFTISQIDAADAGCALFTCSQFIMPRGIEEGKLVYVGDKEVQSLSDLLPQGIDLGTQLQRGNNSLAGISNYLHMESGWFRTSSAEEVELAAPQMKHSNSLVTLQIKRPEGWTGQVSEVALTLSSDNVTLLGTTDNRIVLKLEDAGWDDNYILVHFIVRMEGIVNIGNLWKVEVLSSDSKELKLTFPAKQWDAGKHYTSLISDDLSDYETPVYIEVPGFEDAGNAF